MNNQQYKDYCNRVYQANRRALYRVKRAGRWAAWLSKITGETFIATTRELRNKDGWSVRRIHTIERTGE